MPGVGEPAGVGPVVEGRGDGVGDQHATERHVAGVHALGEGDQVRGDRPVVDGEPLPAAAEPAHHLVGDQQDAVLVADLPDALEVARRRHQDAVGADHRLEDDRGDRAWALDHDRVAQVLQRTRALLLLVAGVERRPVQVGPPEVHDPGQAGLGPPPARVTGQRDRPGGRAVVAAVGRQHLVPAGVQPRHPHRVLVGVRPAVGEEHLVQGAGRQVGQQPRRLRAHVVGERRGHRAQAPGVLLDRRDQPRVLVADVDVDQLRGEVEVLGPCVVPEVRAERRRDRQRVDLRLGRPGVEDVGAVVAAHLLLGERGQEGGLGHRGVLLWRGQRVRGKPRSTWEVAGSGQREVTTLPRV